MIVQIAGSHFIYCDAPGCNIGDNPNADGDGARGARRNARELGWQCRAWKVNDWTEYRDLCPDCAAKERNR